MIEPTPHRRPDPMEEEEREMERAMRAFEEDEERAMRQIEQEWRREHWGRDPEHLSTWPAPAPRRRGSSAPTRRAG